MPTDMNPGVDVPVFFFDEKKIKKLVRSSLRDGEKLIKVHFDRWPPADEPWERNGHGDGDRYIEVELEVPAFDYDAAPELGETTVITVRGYTGLSVNVEGGDPDDKRADPDLYTVGVAAYAFLEWL